MEENTWAQTENQTGEITGRSNANKAHRKMNQFSNDERYKIFGTATGNTPGGNQWQANNDWDDDD